MTAEPPFPRRSAVAYGRAILPGPPGARTRVRRRDSPSKAPAMWYDLVVAAILLFCAVRGARKGFVWQLAAIAAVILCFVFAETVSVATAPYLKVKPPLNRWISMLLLYLACSFICFALARGLKNGLEKAKFEDYDRHLGGIFGLVKGAGIAVVVTFFAVTLFESLRPTVLRSYSGHAAAVAMYNLSPAFPEELAGVLQPYLDNFEGFEEGPSGTRLVDGTADPDDLFGEGNGGAANGLGDWFADDGPTGDGFTDDGTGGGDWPDETPVARGSSEDTDGAFGATDGIDDDPFGDDPGRGEWLTEDGDLNRDRLRDEAGRLGRDLWDSVPEETRRDVTNSVTDRLKQRAGGEFDRRFGEFLGDPNAVPDEARRSRQELIAEIAQAYTAESGDVRARDEIRRNAARALGAVPEEAAYDILRDWLADLRGASAGPDPDPETTIATTLKERIARHVRARVARPSTDFPPGPPRR